MDFLKGDIVLIEQKDSKFHYVFDHIEGDDLIVQVPNIHTGNFEPIYDTIKIKDIISIKLDYQDEFEIDMYKRYKDEFDI